MKVKFPDLFERLVPIFFVVIIGLAFFVGILWQKVQYLEKGVTTNTTANTQTAQQADPTISIDAIKGLWDKDLIKFGDANRKVLFVAVEDPSCPYCAIASGLNSELNKSAGAQFTLVKDGGTYVAPVEEMRKLVDSKKASFVYIYTPGHGNGEMGMKALYCAQEKGKFWQAHDILMSASGYSLLNDTIKNDKTKSGELAEFLKSAVNPGELKSCIDSGKYDARLTADVTIAQSLAVSGTPGFFVNTTRFGGAYSYSDMESVVTAALQ